MDPLNFQHLTWKQNTTRQELNRRRRWIYFLPRKVEIRDDEETIWWRMLCYLALRDRCRRIYHSSYLNITWKGSFIDYSFITLYLLLTKSMRQTVMGVAEWFNELAQVSKTLLKKIHILKSSKPFWYIQLIQSSTFWNSNDLLSNNDLTRKQVIFNKSIVKQCE